MSIAMKCYYKKKLGTVNLKEMSMLLKVLQKTHTIEQVFCNQYFCVRLRLVECVCCLI